jgi:hypothetical protein
MHDPYAQAQKLIGDLDDMHRLTPAERVARAQVLATLAQAEAGRATIEALGRIADALEHLYPDALTGPRTLVSRMVPRPGRATETISPTTQPQAGQ